MKLRKIFFLTLGLSAAFSFASCESEKEKEEIVTLNVTPTSIEAPGRSKESFKVMVETIGPWLAEPNKDFVTVSPTWSIGNTEMTITVDKNRTDVPRDAEVTISIDGAEPVTVKIQQEAGVVEEIGQRKFYVTTSGLAEADGLAWDSATTFEHAYDEAVAGEEIHFAVPAHMFRPRPLKVLMQVKPRTRLSSLTRTFPSLAAILQIRRKVRSQTLQRMLPYSAVNFLMT